MTEPLCTFDLKKEKRLAIQPNESIAILFNMLQNMFGKEKAEKATKGLIKKEMVECSE